MKIDIYLNDYFVKYNSAQKTEVENLRIGFVEGIYNPDDLFILRGEPTYREDLHKILRIFKNKNYILTTQGFNIQSLIDFDDTIPYLSFHWDGFLNDSIKQSPGLTYNMIRCIEALKHKNMKFRIAYTISPYNINSLDADIAILRSLLSSYSKMKQPYFMIYQEGQYYSQSDYTWTWFGKEHLEKINKSGLCTVKNFNYLSNWVNGNISPCTSIQSEATVMPDATLRACQSYQSNCFLGSLKEKNIPTIFKDSESIFKSLEKCSFRKKCWLAYHNKEEK
jgi:MoaA/NifB/PqqE/SkfB family radical SAM enzyme